MLLMGKHFDWAIFKSKLLVHQRLIHLFLWAMASIAVLNYWSVTVYSYT